MNSQNCSGYQATGYHVAIHGVSIDGNDDGPQAQGHSTRGTGHIPQPTSPGPATSPWPWARGPEPPWLQAWGRKTQARGHKPGAAGHRGLSQVG